MSVPIFRPADHVIEHDGKSIALTPDESAILGRLVKNPGRVISHNSLLQELWPLVVDEPNNPKNVIGVKLGLLRRKLEPLSIRIENRWATGYYLIGELTVDWTAL